MFWYRPSSLTEDRIKAYINNEVRYQLLGSASVAEHVKSGFPPVKKLPSRDSLRILVTGGAGFVGSHLVDRLMMAGHSVIVVDNMFTGRKKNIQQWIGHPNFQLIIHDVVEPIMMEVCVLAIYDALCVLSQILTLMLMIG